MNRPRLLVLLVHGIRTQAEWHDSIKMELERYWESTVRPEPKSAAAPSARDSNTDTEQSTSHAKEDSDLKIIPLKYGYFDTVKFWCPIWFRRYPINTLKWKIRKALGDFEGHDLIIVAHSFGTYAIAKILQEEPTIKPRRLLLCGSIVSTDFRWDKLANCGQVVNDIGTQDIWPVMAKSTTWGYGASGAFGFGTPGIEDRFHPIKHSDFFSECDSPDSILRKYWIPWIIDGRIVPSVYESARPTTPYLLSLLTVVQLKYLAILICVVILFIPPWPRNADLRQPVLPSSFPTPSSIADRPTIGEVQQKPVVQDLSKIVLKINNETGRDLWLLGLDFTRHYAGSTDVVEVSPWATWPLPHDGEIPPDNDFSSGTGWYCFFVQDGTGASQYLGKQNIFAAETTTITIDRGSAFNWYTSRLWFSRPFVARFSQSDR